MSKILFWKLGPKGPYSPFAVDMEKKILKKIIKIRYIPKTIT